MSEIYRRARVQLIDEVSGLPVGDVEIISDSQEIFYNNDKPMFKKVGNFKEGTTFEKFSLAAILDGILYENEAATGGGSITSNGDATNVSGEVTVVKAFGDTVKEFTLSTTVHFNSYDKITVTLLQSSPSGNHRSDTKVVTRPDKTTTETVVSFTVQEFSEDTDIAVQISSGDGTIYTASIIHYQFVHPIYVGWIRSDIIQDDGELNKDIAEDYFEEALSHDHGFNTIEKRFVVKSSQNQYIVPGLNYDTRQKLNPCILIPQTWGELVRIDDTNGNDITNSFATLMPIDINTHDTYIDHYIAYVSRQTFDDDFELCRGIKYITESDKENVRTDNLTGVGIPLTCGFTVHYNIPIDDRFYKKTYGDLLKTQYAYPGLLTYVEDINTTFRFEKGHWSPTCNKIHVVESLDELTEDLGGWDDLAIVATPGGEDIGNIWKKRYNNQWERYGDFKIEDGNIHFVISSENNE